MASLAICMLLVSQTRAAETLKVTPKSGTIELVGVEPDSAHKGGFKRFSGTVKVDTENPAARQVVIENDDI